MSPKPNLVVVSGPYGLHCTFLHAPSLQGGDKDPFANTPLKVEDPRSRMRKLRTSKACLLLQRGPDPSDGVERRDT